MSRSAGRSPPPAVSAASVRRERLPIGPVASQPTSHLVAALRVLPAQGAARSALDAVVRDLEARVRDPTRAGRAAPEAGSGAERDIDESAGLADDADIAPASERPAEPSLAPDPGAPDAIYLARRWLDGIGPIDEAAAAARRRAHEEPREQDDGAWPADGHPAPLVAEGRPDLFARHDARPGGGDPLDPRREPPGPGEKGRAARDGGRERVRKANQALDQYPVPEHTGKAIEPPQPERGKGPAAAPPAPKPQDKGKQPGASGTTMVEPGAAGTAGGAAAVDAWKEKVATRTGAIKVPPVADADRYVVTFKDAETAKTGDTKTKTKKMIAEARAAVKPRKELEEAPELPNTLPEARKLVDDLAPRPIPPDTLPRLERTPFKTIAELGTFVYRVTDKTTGKPTGEEHILRELGKDELGQDKYAEIHIVGHGKKAPPSLGGMKSEVRRPEGKPPAKGTLEERVTAINQAQSELVLKANPKAGGPVTLEVDLPLAAAEVPADFKVDVGAILARILASPNRYAKQITDAAASSFPGGSALPAAYADEFIGAVAGDLAADLDKVRAAADVKAEDLEEALELEKTKLDAKAKEEEARARTAHRKAKATEKRETKLVADHIGGVREDIDHWLDDIAASTKGGYDAKTIKDERDKLIAASKAKVELWVGQWEGMRKQRRKNLGEAASRRMMAYDAAAQMDRRRLAVEGKIDLTKFNAKKAAGKQADYTPEEAEYAAAIDKLDTWLKGTGPESLTVRETKLFEDLQSTYDGKVDDAIQALKDAHKEAKLLIEQWASERLNKEIGLVRKIVNAILDWLGVARKDIDDWEVASVEDNDAVNAENNLFLEEMKTEYEKGLTKEKIDAMKGLTAEQKAILTAYFVDPSTKGDAVAALAAGLVMRLKAQREPVVHRKIEAKLLKDQQDVVVKVANARGRIDVAGKCYELAAAMLGMGTEKQKIYDALAGLDPVEARAIELYYEHTYPGRSLRLELAGELHDVGEQLWGSKHDFQRAAALLDARPSAGMEAVAVELDQTMKGGVYGIGTDKKRMFELLRNRTPAELAAIKRWYRKKYNRDLELTAYDELDDGISAHYDSMRFDALMKRDTKLADTLGLRSAMGARKEEGDPLTWLGSRLANWATRDQEAAVGTFDSIKDDIKADARRWGWTIEQQKAEYKRRVGAMEGEFSSLFADEYLKPGDGRSAMTAAFGQSFGHDEARLLEGKRTDNLALISAATVSIEHKAILLPSRKKIDDTLAAQYRTAFDEAMWDLDLEFNKRKAKELDAAKTPEERDAVLARWADPKWVFDERKKLEKKAHEAALVKAGANMRALKDVYDQEFTYGFWTHGSFEKDMMAATAPSAFFTNFQGPGDRNLETDKTFALITQSGYLRGEQLLYFGAKGAGTTEEDIKYAHAGKSQAEIEEMYLGLAKRLTGTDYRNASAAEKKAAVDKAQAWVLDDFSGREYVDTKVDMYGVAVTPEQKIEKAKLRQQATLESMQGGIGDVIVGGVLLGPIGALAGPSLGGSFRRWMSRDELAIIEKEIGRLEAESKKVADLKAEIARMPLGKERELKYKELEKQYERVALIEKTVDAAFVLQRKQVDSIVDTVTTIIQIVVTVAAILAAPFTGGGSVAAATVMWMAVAASVATSLLSMAAKAILKGGDYGWEEFAFDAAMAVIEAVAAAATANLGDKFLKAAFIKNLVEGGVVARLAGHGLANGLEGIIQAVPGALFGAVANDATWQDGNPFMAIVGAVATGAALSGAMSGAFGALRAFKKGAPHTQLGETPEPPTAVELAVARGTKPDMEAMYKAYKARKPGGTFAEFRVELDETILRMNKGAFDDHPTQRALRKEILEGLPIPQRKALAGSRIEIMTDVDFRRAFGDTADPARVVLRGGKPVVAVRAGADLSTLGRQAPHVFGAEGPRAPRPRGASADNDPLAPGARKPDAELPGGKAQQPAPRVIMEPFAGPGLDSPVDLARQHPGAKVIATERSLKPSAAEIKKLEAAGGVFHPDNMPAKVPINSVDEIKLRFPLPDDDAVAQQFMRHLADVQRELPGLHHAKQLDEAMRRVDSLTQHAPYSLQRLKPGGELEVVFLEPRIAAEVQALEKLRFVDPITGRVYKLELVSSGVMPKSQIAPHSGFATGLGPHDPVNVAVLRKVELKTVKGEFSGRPFQPGEAGGPIRDLDFQRIKITDKGVDAVERHVRRFDGGGEMELAMVERLRRIAKGDIKATPEDKAFYAHELRESIRYKKAGFPRGQPADPDASYALWNDLHTATLEDYKLRERTAQGKSTLFHPDVEAAAAAKKPSGARGPDPAPEPRPWDRDLPLGSRADAAAQAEGGRCAAWVWVMAMRNAGWSGAVVDHPGDVAKLVRTIRDPATGAKLPRVHGSPADLVAAAQGMAPGTQIIVSARSANGVWHAMLAVVRADGSLELMHASRPVTRAAAPDLAAPGAGARPGERLRVDLVPDPAGDVLVKTRIYSAQTPELAAYRDHRWWVLPPLPGPPPRAPRVAVPADAPRTKLLPDGDRLPPRGRKLMEQELQSIGVPESQLRRLDDNQLAAAHARAQVELAPRRMAAFRETLDWRAKGELDALQGDTHLHHRPIDELTRYRLQSALGGTPVRTNPTLLPGEVQVKYKVGLLGNITGIELHLGPGATLTDALLHVGTLHAFMRYRGLTGAVARVIDAVSDAVSGRVRMPVGTRAHEAWRELQKLPAIIQSRQLRLASGSLDLLTRVRVEIEIEALERQLARHVQEIGDFTAGRGYVASQGPRRGAHDVLSDAAARAELKARLDAAMEAQKAVFDMPEVVAAKERLLKSRPVAAAPAEPAAEPPPSTAAAAPAPAQKAPKPPPLVLASAVEVLAYGRIASEKPIKARAGHYDIEVGESRIPIHTQEKGATNLLISPHDTYDQLVRGLRLAAADAGVHPNDVGAHFLDFLRGKLPDGVDPASPYAKKLAHAQVIFLASEPGRLRTQLVDLFHAIGRGDDFGRMHVTPAGMPSTKTSKMPGPTAAARALLDILEGVAAVPARGTKLELALTEMLRRYRVLWSGGRTVTASDLRKLFIGN